VGTDPLSGLFRRKILTGITPGVEDVHGWWLGAGPRCGGDVGETIIHPSYLCELYVGPRVMKINVNAVGTAAGKGRNAWEY